MSQVLYETANRVATVTLNRPERMNAWTKEMGYLFRQAIEAAEQDPEIRVVVITGAGRAFCAGGDTSMLSAAESEAFKAMRPDDKLPGSLPVPSGYRGPYTFLSSVAKPTIAAINGAAVGLGFVIALFADLRIANEEAVLSLPFTRLGLIAEQGIAWHLSRLAGVGVATDLLLTGRRIKGSEALDLGVVHRSVSAGSLAGEVEQLANELANGVAPNAAAAVKTQIYAATEESLGAAAARSEAEFQNCLELPDLPEGVAALRERRLPKFADLDMKHLLKEKKG